MVNAKFASCTFVEVKSDGSLVMAVEGDNLSVTMRHAVIPPEKADAANDLLARRAPRVKLRCELSPSEPRRVINIEFLAWRDKSGDVWQDLGQELIKLGLAKTKKR